jgi:DNA-binding MarR family transcriptional regulator
MSTKYSFTKLALPLKLEQYVVEVLLRDLVGHDRSPAAFLVYFSLYALTYAASRRSVRLSLKQIAERTGLSKSAVQAALRILSRRQLIRAQHATRTAIREYFVQRPWAR